MDDNYKKEDKDVKKFRRSLEPGPLTKFFNSINPQTSLGKGASKDFHENSFIISMILIFTLAIGAVSTTMFVDLYKYHPDKGKEERFSGSIAAVTWFAFFSFTFLVFEATRIFHIFLFMYILGAAVLLSTELDQNSLAGKLAITTLVLSAIPLMILLGFYFSGTNEEVVALKTLEKERRARDDIARQVSKLLEKREEEVKKKLEADFTSETGIRSKIAQAYIDKIIADAKKPAPAPKKEDKKKKEEEKKEKKEE